MSKHSVSEAARLAGVSRSYFYKKYIKPGLISVERDGDDNPVIDTAEIMRVFGQIQGDSQQTVSRGQEDTPGKDTKITLLEAENRLLREQLAVAQDRERWMQQTVDKLTDQLKLLEHKPEPEPTRKGFFARLFGG